MAVNKEVVEYQEFAKRFIAGEQNILYDGYRKIVIDIEKEYWWQSNNCFNLFPIIEAELSRFKWEYERCDIIKQLAEYQYRYNKLMNLVSDLSKQLIHPTLAVEDGSVDVDDLCEDGVSPGKIVIYRQGSKEPRPLFDIPPQAISVLSEEAKSTKSEFYDLANVLFANASSNKGMKDD